MKIYYKRSGLSGNMYLEHDTETGTFYRVYAKTKVRMYRHYPDPNVSIKEWLRTIGYKQIFPKYLQVDEGL